MTNPFSGGTAGTIPPTNPRGPSFRIKSGDQVFEGRAVNASYVVNLLAKSQLDLVRTLASELKPEFGWLNDRLKFLESELGVTPPPRPEPEPLSEEEQVMMDKAREYAAKRGLDLPQAKEDGSVALRFL